jgi:hypothetical protein
MGGNFERTTSLQSFALRSNPNLQRLNRILLETFGGVLNLANSRFGIGSVSGLTSSRETHLVGARI